MKILNDIPVQLSDDDVVWFQSENFALEETKKDSYIQKGSLLKSHIAHRCGLISDPRHYDGKITHIDGNSLNCQRSNLRREP